MVVVVSRKPNQAHKRLQEKLDHLLHQKGEDESGLEAIRAFRTQVSKGLRGLIAGSEAQVRSLSWVDQGLKLLRGLDSAFRSLIEAVDCPMSKWGPALADEYLGYTLRLLDLFNSISASLAHLQSVRLSLAHALSSPSSAATRLLSFAHRDRHRARSWAAESGRGSRGDSCHGKERSLLEALLEMKGVALWVCRAVLSGLGGEMVEADFPLLADLDSRDYGEFTELREVNEMVSGLLGAAPLQVNEDESKEMQRKVESFQRKLEVAVEEVNCFFSQVLASRNTFIDCFSLQNQ